MEVYKFNSKKDFNSLINAERKAAWKLFKETGEQKYNSYATYCETTIYNYQFSEDADIKKIEISNLKEFIINEWVKWETRINIRFGVLNFPLEKIMKYDPTFKVFYDLTLDKLGKDFLNTIQLQ